MKQLTDIHNQQKTHMVKSLLSDRKTRNTIREALKAPIGSTKRVYAKNVLNIMNKLRGQHDTQTNALATFLSSQDGSGGPGYQGKQPYRAPEKDPVHIPTDHSNPLMVLPSIPKPKFTYGRTVGRNSGTAHKQQMASKMDGMGGPGDDFMGSSDSNSTQSYIPTPDTTDYNFQNALGDTSNIQAAAPSNATNPMQDWNDLTQKYAPQTANDVWSSMNPNFKMPSYNFNTQAGQPIAPGGFVPGAPDNTATQNTTGAEYATGPGAFLGGAINSANGGQQTNTQQTQGATTGGNASSPQSYGSNTQGMNLNNLQGGLMGYAGAAQKAVNSNIGPTGFALNALNDKNNPITGGKTLAQMEGDNANKLDTQYGLTSLRSQMEGEQNSNVGIKDQLTSYITGRDQMLKDIDSTIDQTETQMFTHGGSPAAMESSKNYLNYLYTQRGQQQQRYVDMYNGAIQQASDHLKATTDNYNTALTAYTNQLTTDNKATEDDYNMYAKALTDMYTTMQQAPQVASQLEYQKLQVQALQQQIAQTSITNQYGASYYKDLPKITATKMLTDSKGYVSRSGVSSDTLQQLITQNPDISPANIYQAYQNGILNYLAAPSNAKAAPSKDGYGLPITSKTKQAVGASAIQTYGNIYQQGQAVKDANTTTMAWNQAKSIADKMAYSNTADVTGTQATMDALAGVFSSKPGLFGGSGPTEKDVATALTNAGASNSSEVAKGLMAQYTQYLKDYKGGDGQSAYVKNLQNSTMGSKMVNDALSGYYLQQYFPPQSGGTSTSLQSLWDAAASDQYANELTNPYGGLQGGTSDQSSSS